MPKNKQFGLIELMKLEEYFFILKRLLLAFTLYPVVRILFVLFNFDLYTSYSLSEFINPFLYGFRFDLSSVLIVNSIFIIMSLIPFRNRIYNILLKITFVISNVFAIGLNIVDFEFFKFTGKRLTADIFGIAGDIGEQAFQIIFYYWYFVILIFICALYYWKLFPKLGKYQNPRIIRYRWTPLIGLLLIILVFIGIRGGLQIRSISPKQAYIFKHYDLGHFAINSAYTLARSVGAEKFKKISYFDSDKIAIEVIKNNKTKEAGFEGIPKTNIVIIILESFSQEYIDDGFAPFFNELSKKGLYFNKNLANGRRSIEALPSILAGMPSVLEKPLYQSKFQTNKFNSLASILENSGYDSSFFHGGKTGTMDFDAYTKSIGFQYYYGMEDYPEKDQFDGAWGIYDDQFLKWFGQKLNKEQEPFLSVMFTLSSHQPYAIPKEFQDKFPKGNLEIHESIGYVDESLREFFETNKNKKWFKNTLFVITADHTQKTNGIKYNTTLGKYRVPLLFYHPRKDLSSGNESLVTQHADILPSVLDFLGVEPQKNLLYGDSVFNKKEGPVFNYINGSYVLYTENTLIRSTDGKIITYAISDDLLSETPSKLKTSSHERLIQSYIQYTINGLIKNDLYK